MARGFTPKIRNSLLLVVGPLFALIAAIAYSFFQLSSAHAATDGCFASGGASCQEVFAIGRTTPIDDVYYGSGGVYMERKVRAFLYDGTKDNEKYMVYIVTVTLNPDPDVRRYQLVTNGPDSSPLGDFSNMHVRLWSTNRNSCSDAGGVLLLISAIIPIWKMETTVSQMEDLRV